MRRAAAIALSIGVLVAVGRAGVGCSHGDVTSDRSEEHARTTTQSLASAVWSEAPDAGGPRRQRFALAYDAKRSVVVMFGGTTIASPELDYAPSFPLGDTWEWDGARWTKRCDACGPAPRMLAAMTYDERAGRVLMYGGKSWDQATGHGRIGLADLWAWDGTTWSLLCDPCAPGPREASAMAYDGARDVTVLTGGADGYWINPGATPTVSGTWEWDGSTWSRRCVGCGGPEGAVDGAMVYDARRARMVFVGGRPFHGYCVEFCVGQPGCPCDGDGGAGRFDTWEWDGSTWTLRCDADATSGPLACGLPRQRFGFGLAYDSVRGKTVLFGGYGSEGMDLGDTLEWDGTTWTALCGHAGSTGAAAAPCGPNARHGLRAVFDAARRATLVFGGTTKLALGSHDDTWLYRVRGEPCASSDTCDTGSCVDGVCCERPACATCEACDLPGTEGRCAPVRGADDPDTCAGTRSCKALPTMLPDGGAQACGAKNGQPCSGGGDCLSGYCADGVCCDTACEQSCDACTVARGAPADGTCGPALAGSPGDPPCVAHACTGTSTTCEPDAPCSAGDPSGLCAERFYCAPDGRCRPEVDCACAPYRCNEDGTCKSSCESVADCEPPNVCDHARRCVPLPRATSAGPGCSASPASGSPAAWLLALLLLRRRRTRTLVGSSS